MWIGNIIPQIVRLISLDQLVVLRIGIHRIAFGVSRHARHEVDKAFDALVLERPVYTTGIVYAEFKSLGAHGRGQFAHDIACCVPARLVGIWHVAWPESESIMVFRDEDHISSPRALEEPRPGCRVPGLQRVVESLTEMVIGIVFAKCLPVIGRCRTILEQHCVLVPRGIRRIGKSLTLIGYVQLINLRMLGREGRDRIRPPVDEYPELRIAKPFRCFVRAEAFGRC